MAATALRMEHERYARVESVRLGGVPMAVEWMPYGAEGAGPAQEIVATYGLLELEYAAFRRGAAIMDRADRATLVVTGKDRMEFLNRMMTQELKGMSFGQVRQAFWLNRKGRIDADLMLCELPECTLIDLDWHDAAHTLKTLSAFVFAEDVHIRDGTGDWSRISVHGPEGLDLLGDAGVPTDLLRVLNSNGTCVEFCMDGGDGDAKAKVVAARRDQCAAMGMELWMQPAQAAAFFERVIRIQDGAPNSRRKARPAGWYAYNIARIEAGTPLFHIDFGPENLPHESGALPARVSFKKGCYLGQEVVARMESLGKPKQRLISLRMSKDLLPCAGDQICERTAEGEAGAAVGMVTSSALSPMLGSVPVAFAMVKSAHAQPGQVLVVHAEGAHTDVTVREGLAFVDAEGKPL